MRNPIKVWVARELKYDGDRLIGVFSSEELAERALDRRYIGVGWRAVDEVEIDFDKLVK